MISHATKLGKTDILTQKPKKSKFDKERYNKLIYRQIKVVKKFIFDNIDITLNISKLGLNLRG